VNVRRGDRAREIEVIRTQYKRHRDALTSMIADAPTDHLATEYQRLIVELDMSLAKLNELETPTLSGALPPRTNADTQPMSIKSEPGRRPLVTTPVADYEALPEEPAKGNRSLLMAIILAGLVVLGVLGWLMWRSADERPSTPIVDEQQTETAVSAVPDDTTIAPVRPVETAPAGGLKIEPSAQDFGIIRRGTRAVRQFELSNTTEQPITITLVRSTCRCLYYSHAPVVPPRGKETITVTIDAARVKAGSIRETIKVSAKSDPKIATALTVSATIR
jgi:hypothetical protein